MKKDTKILIVEDEEDINKLLEMVLVSGGYNNILKAFDGEEALDIINNNRPDLILMDIMIPKIDGLTLSKIIKDNPILKSIRIIMLTAKKMEEDILKGFESGAIDYITKPFSNKILLARINAHLHSDNDSNISYKNFSLDEKKSTVSIDNIPIKRCYLNHD